MLGNEPKGEGILGYWVEILVFKVYLSKISLLKSKRITCADDIDDGDDDDDDEKSNSQVCRCIGREGSMTARCSCCIIMESV